MNNAEIKDTIKDTIVTLTRIALDADVRVRDVLGPAIAQLEKAYSIAKTVRY